MPSSQAFASLSAERPTSGSLLHRAGWWGIWLFGLVLGARFSFYEIFSQFHSYDDEGFVLVSLRDFLRGKKLYDEIYSCYQPWFYELDRLLFGLSGMSVSHDSIRMLTICFWLSGAAVSALLTYRLTANRLLSLVAFVVTTQWLAPFAREPGHPQALAYLLVALVVVMFSYLGNSPKKQWLALGIGVLLGMLLLTKLNIGILGLMATGLIFAFDRGTRLSPTHRTLFAGLIGVAPLVLMHSLLGNLIWSPVSLGLLPVVLALMILAIRRWKIQFESVQLVCASLFFFAFLFPQFPGAVVIAAMCSCVLILAAEPVVVASDGKPLLYVLSGSGLAVVGVCLALVITGTTVKGLLNGLIFIPAKQSTVFHYAWNSNVVGTILTWLGILACGSYLYARKGHAWSSGGRTLLLGGKLAFGLTALTWFFFPQLAILKALPDFWMLPFAWLVLVSPAERADQGARIARCALASFTVTQPLIAYPVAGTQLSPASVLLVICSLVCLADALSALPLKPAQGSQPGWFISAFASAGAVVLLVVFGLQVQTMAQVYSSLTPLNLPGAQLVRLRADQAAVLQALVRPLARPEVETFLTFPGMNSLYLWAQKEPPTSLNVTTWMTLLDAESQQRIWQAAEKCHGLVAVRNQRLIHFWTQGIESRVEPLVQHINQEFRPVASIGDYELLVRH